MGNLNIRNIGKKQFPTYWNIKLDLKYGICYMEF